MKIVIIEDEETASARLKKILLELDNSIEIAATLESIDASVKWFNANPAPRLIFADIQLADGPSFEIFKKVKIPVPVIFITAFDNYALQAFKFNGIDYLLKPIKKTDVEQSLLKYKTLQTNQLPPPVDYHEILSAIVSRKPVYQKRLVIRIGQTIRTLEIDDVAYFYTEEKIAFSCSKDNQRLPLDFTLDELEKILDPAEFFRINRQFIIHIKAIGSMFSYSKSRIKVLLKPPSDAETIVSAERSAHFKEWLLGKSQV
jgi:DNA-binding LytR/AlgR family response regulator